MVVAALTDSGPDGVWAESIIATHVLAAPHLMLVEVANILRRATQAGEIAATISSLAHLDLVQLRVNLFPYEPFADRVWQLGSSVTSYDAWYVALAEALDAPLATLDGRLRRANGPRCNFVFPSA